MLQAVEAALPADVAIFAAAVADWRTAEPKGQKIKKTGKGAPELSLVENPDILATIAHDKSRRPKLVIGFAAETENVIENAKAKLARKGCDWIIANDVSPASGVMGGDQQYDSYRHAHARGILAAAIEGRSRRCADRADRGRVRGRSSDERRRSRASRGCRTPPICRCRPIRANMRPGSICSPPCRPMRRWSIAPGKWAAIPTGIVARAAAGHRRPGAPALRACGAARHYGAQFARHDRCGLSR